MCVEYSIQSFNVLMYTIYMFSFTQNHRLCVFQKDLKLNRFDEVKPKKLIELFHQAKRTSMKKPSIILIFLISLSLNSCRIIGDIAIDNFKVEVTRTLDIQGTSNTTSGEVIFDPTSDPEFQKNLKYVNKARLDSVTYVITSLNQSGVSSNQRISMNYEISDSNGESKSTLGNFEINLATAQAQSQEIKLSGVSTSNLDFFKKSPHTALVSYSGSATEAPIDFKVRIKLYLSIN